jgi:nicotinamidase-related amidase
MATHAVPIPEPVKIPLPEAQSPAPVTVPAPSVSVPVDGTALLLIDVINDLAFEGAEALIEPAEQMAERLAVFKKRVTGRGIPAIYVNDTFGDWAPDLRLTVAHCTARMSPGHVVSSLLRPTSRDYFIPKPKHSGFFDTGLDALLDRLRVRRVVLTGIAGNICVLFTASDAYMRDLELIVPEDCVVSNTQEDNAHALRQMAKVMKAKTAPSTQLRFGVGRGAETVLHP